MQEIKLIELRSDQKKQWNNFIDSTPYSTILQFWQWGEVKKSEGWQPFRLAYFDNKEIKIASQVLIKSAPFLGNYLYVPYGPVFRKVTDLERHLPDFLNELKAFAQEKNCFVIEFDPLIGELVEQGESSESLVPYLDKSVKESLHESGFQLSKRNIQPKYKLFYDLTKSE
jgi:lipid II:glycine glycyltransferase (peptidoglycan interpeptide bridge formation enzyme)